MVGVDRALNFITIGSGQKFENKIGKEVSDGRQSVSKSYL